MSNSLQKLFPILILASFVKPLSSQDYLVDHTYLGSYSQLSLSIIFQQPVDYGVDLYKITYKTLDLHHLPDTASGLIALPQVSASTQLPIVVYEHGTVIGPEDVPSKLKGGYEAAMAYAAFGFATFAPDYLGLGDARGFHPWLHSATEASASLDMLFAGYEYLEFNDPDYDPEFLFLSGYSQGGHASMALQKEIDDFWSIIIPVTAATHMSGLYDLSGVMRDRFLSDEISSPAYAAYLFLSYNDVYNIYADIGQLFKEPYATTIEAFYNGSITLDTLGTHLFYELLTTGDPIPKRMLQDSVLEGMINNPNHPLNVAQRNNDTYNWAPSSPTRLYYCEADEVVPIRNSIVADSVMNGLGAVDVALQNIDPGLGHTACAYAAIPVSIDYFLSFVNGTGLEDLDLKRDELKIFPNPSFDDVNIDWEPALNGFDYRIFNNNGLIVEDGTTSSNSLSLSKLTSGLYMIICSADGQTRMGRIFRP